MKQSIIFCLIILLPLIFIAQESGYKIEGNIQDKNTGEPIEDANIKLIDTRYGTTSNAWGNFSINCENLPVKIEISHISYKTVTLLYDHPTFQKLTIQMEPALQPLAEITISAVNIDTLYKSDTYAVLDYELLDEGILLLIFKNRLSRSELLLIDYSGNTLNSLPVLPDKPLMLYLDCLGYTHVITKSQAFQIYWKGEKPLLYPPYSIEEFKKTMSGCKFKLHNKLYFEEFGFYDLKKQFYYVNTSTEDMVLLTVVQDNEKLGFLYDNPESYGFLSGNSTATLGDLKGLPGDRETLGQIRNLDFEARFNQMAYLSEINVPIFNMGDSIFIFNHPENKIEVYNDADSLIHTTDISYHLTERKNALTTLIRAFAKNKRWMEAVYTDEISRKAYTLYKNLNGTSTLKQIDLTSGEVSTDILTIPFPFVQKIKIRNDELFFIYRGWGESKRKKLFRQKIR